MIRILALFLVAALLAPGLARASCSQLSVPAANMQNYPLLYIYGLTLGPGGTPGASPLAGNSDCTIGGSGGSSSASPAVAFTPTPGGTVTTLAVTTTSANVALPTGTTDAITNTGTSTVYANLGASSVTAGTSNYGIAPGSTVYWTPGSATYIAGITASGTGSLSITGGALAGGGTVIQGTTTDPPAITITTSSTQLIGASTGTRVRVTAINQSTTAGNDVWCRTDGSAAVVNQGIDLPPNKGGYEWDYPLVNSNQPINCIATSASATVTLEAVQ